MNIRQAAPALTLLAASIASAQSDSSLQAAPDRGSESASPTDPPEHRLEIDAALSFTPPPAFGAADSRYWGLTTGAGIALEDNDDSTDLNLGLTYHYFLVDDFEIIGEIGGWYFAQDGNDAGGLNPGFSLRWHALNRDSWSLYVDTGIGLLFASDDVPTGGTSFGLMPRVGAGASFRLNNEGLRGYLGARWHHVSNAQITGDEGNPDRDGVMLYGGLMFPF